MYKINNEKDRKCVYKRDGIIMIALCLFVIVIVIVMFSICMMFIQINTKVANIKENVGLQVINIAKNNCNTAALKYGIYDFNEEKIKEDLSYVLENDYNMVSLKSVNYDYKNKLFKVYLNVEFIPIIKFQDKKYNITLKEEVKFNSIDSLLTTVKFSL